MRRGMGHLSLCLIMYLSLFSPAPKIHPSMSPEPKLSSICTPTRGCTCISVGEDNPDDTGSMLKQKLHPWAWKEVLQSDYGTFIKCARATVVLAQSPFQCVPDAMGMPCPCPLSLLWGLWQEPKPKLPIEVFSTGPLILVCPARLTHSCSSCSFFIGSQVGPSSAPCLGLCLCRSNIFPTSLLWLKIEKPLNFLHHFSIVSKNYKWFCLREPH